MHESSSWDEIRLHAENQLPGCPGIGLKVCLVGGGGHEPITLSLEWSWVELGYDNLKFKANQAQESF